MNKRENDTLLLINLFSKLLYIIKLSSKETSLSADTKKKLLFFFFFWGGGVCVKINVTGPFVDPNST